MKLYFTALALLLTTCCLAQSPIQQPKLSPTQQKEDVEFLEKQIFDAHADPFTELNQKQYTQVFDSIEFKIKDSTDVTAFYKLIRPAISWLSDEHAGFDIDTAKLNNTYRTAPIFLPFTLKKQGDIYIVDQLLTPTTTLKIGDTILQVNNISVAVLINRLTQYTTGFPGQRYQAALTQFGYLYGWAADNAQEHFTIRTGSKKGIIINGINLKTWLRYRANHSGIQDCPQMISYTRFGDAGYINSCSFVTHSDKQTDSLKNVIDKLFAQAKADVVKYLFIDVSKNGGGNSQVGDIMINDFYAKPYLGYQCNWKRSDEYLKLIKSWGMNDSVYTSRPVGSIIHWDAQQNTPSEDTNSSRFNGKVYVVVGNGTFSSAMMFATIIKDNHIATLVGQTPQNGHPDHFGEVYNTKLPNSKIGLRFGVKEWIRPAGKLADNNLRPDIIIDLDISNEELIKEVIK